MELMLVAVSVRAAIEREAMSPLLWLLLRAVA